MLDTKPSFVVVDYETTGLKPALGIPLELGMLVVDHDLNVLARKDMLIHPTVMPIWDQLDPAVVEMHTKSGLIDALYNSDTEDSVSAVEAAFIRFLVENRAEDLPMCGSTVGFDRLWMQMHMEELERHFHYRNIDISSVKELCRRYNPRVFAAAPAKKNEHRSLPDCYETLEELEFYLQEFLMVDDSE